MGKWEIKSRIEFGEINLGMVKSEVNEILGANFSHGKMILYPGMTEDNYSNTISIYYNEGYTVQAISISSPRKVYYEGENLIKRDIDFIKDFFKKKGCDLINVNTYHLVCYSKGISLGIEDRQDNKNYGQIVSVLLFVDGYQEDCEIRKLKMKEMLKKRVQEKKDKKC